MMTCDHEKRLNAATRPCGLARSVEMRRSGGTIRATVLAVMFAGSGMLSPALADIQPGATSTVTHGMTFSANLTDVTLDPTPNTGTRVQYTFTLNESEDVAAEIGSQFIQAMLLWIGIDMSDMCTTILEVDLCLLDLVLLATGNPMSMPLAIDAEVGGYFEVREVSGADIDITYPISVIVEYPAANSFSCGDTITLSTTCSVQSGSNLVVAPPFYDTDIGLIIDNLNFGGFLNVCAGACPFCLCLDHFIDLPSVGINPISLPQLPPLFTICNEGVGTVDTDALFGCGRSDQILSAALLPLLDIDATDGQTCIEPGFATLAPEINACFSEPRPSDLALTTVGSCNAGYKMTRQGTKNDVVEVCTDVISWIDTVLCPLPQPLSCTEIDFGVVSVDIGDISPAYHLDQQMLFEAEPVVYLMVDLAGPGGTRALPYREIDPNTHAVVGSGTASNVRIRAGNNLEVDFPQELRQPITAAPTYDAESSFRTQIVHNYSMGLNFRLFELEVDGVLNEALIDDQVIRQPIGSEVIEDHTQTLNGAFSSFVMPSFALDPENPVIDITRLEVQDVVNLGGGERAVVYGVDIRNSGDSKLEQVSCDLNLGATYATAFEFEVLCVSSATLPTNAAYDGSSNMNLLDATTVVEIGQEATVEVLVRVKPEVSAILPGGCFATVDYFASSKARGVSCLGTLVESNFDECTQQATAEDIVAAVDLGAAVIASLDQYAVYGWEGVELSRGMDLSKGHVGSGRDLMQLPYRGASSGDLRIIGDVHVADDMHVTQSHLTLDYAQITDTLFMNDPRSSLTPTGAISQPTDCASLFPVPDPAIPQVPNGAGDVVVQAGETVMLLPGDYHRLTVKRGAELVLPGGVYNFGRLRMDEDGAALRFDVTGGPVVVNLNAWLMGSAEGLALTRYNGEGSTRDIFINYGGNSKQIFRNSLVQGNLLAPNAAIKFDHGSVLEGACYAKKVHIGPNSRFTYHKYLEPLAISVECQLAACSLWPVCPQDSSDGNSFALLASAKIMDSGSNTQNEVDGNDTNAGAGNGFATCGAVGMFPLAFMMLGLTLIRHRS